MTMRAITTKGYSQRVPIVGTTGVPRKTIKSSDFLIVCLQNTLSKLCSYTH